MDHPCKTAFTTNILKNLSATGLGKLVSVQDVDGAEVITIDIGPMEIPQYPVHPVKTIERINVISVDDDLPVVYCRNDFPIVPHLNVLPDGRKTLCLFDVPFNDIRYIFSASMFLQRIVYWFEQTARAQLHQADQPLEPYFPGTCDGLILSDFGYPFVRLKKIKTLNGVLYKEIPLENISEGKVYILLKAGIKKNYTKNIINRMPQTLGELDAAFEENILKELEDCFLEIWAVKQTPLYKTIFQEKETELRNSGVLLAVQIGLSRSESEEPERYYTKAFQVSDTFQSLYQAFGYQRNKKKKLEKVKTTEDYKNISITPFEMFYQFNSQFATFLNEGTITEHNNNMVQIGLGALGSQIANNCIRAGYGNWTYIDPDVLYPHNLARHCLNQDSIGRNKAQAMQQYANLLFDGKDNIIKTVIPSDIFSKSEREKIMASISAATLVVDCSASVAAERYLSHELAGKTRSVSFFMNPTGTALIMLLESADRSITLDALEMQYYRLLIREKKLWNHLKSDHKVLYSSTCRGASLVYPQDNAAIFSGLCSSAIKQISSSPNAAISMWVYDDLSITRYKEIGEVFQEVDCNGWKIKISASLITQIYDQRKTKLPNETGGVLIGAYDYAHNICYIVDAIDSPSDSEEYPNSYVRGHNGLLKQIEQLEEITIGNLTYIGEWHSHPTASTQPSKYDLILLKSISDYTLAQGNPGCMLIVGDSNFSVYLQSI